MRNRNGPQLILSAMPRPVREGKARISLYSLPATIRTKLKLLWFRLQSNFDPRCPRRFVLRLHITEHPGFSVFRSILPGQETAKAILSTII